MCLARPVLSSTNVRSPLRHVENYPPEMLTEHFIIPYRVMQSLSSPSQLFFRGHLTVDVMYLNMNGKN